MNRIRTNEEEPYLNSGIMVRLYWSSSYYNPNRSSHRAAFYDGDGVVLFANGNREKFIHIEEWYYINELEPEHEKNKR